MSAPRRGPLFRWLDDRYGLEPLMEFLRHKEVPVGSHSVLWYYLGGATLFFFVLQVATGVLLLAYYQPGRDSAHETIVYIATKVPFGWLIRAMHVWGAHLMTLALLAHMFSTMLLKAYRPPRELTWATGCALLAVVLGFGFSGYLLPWNELAFFATAVGTDMVKAVPLVGDWLLLVLRGGPDVSIETLYRFFALHVVVLPLATVGVVAVHVLFVQRQGMAPPVGHARAPRGMRFFPDFALRDLLLWLVLLIALVSLAVWLPYGPGIPGVEWALGEKADPLQPAYPGIKPEWYFLWVYQLLREFPPHVAFMEGPQAALLMVVVLLAVWILVPWLDRRARRDLASPGFTDLGVASLLFVTVLTLEAWDIGDAGAASPDHGVVARHAASWTLGIIGVTTLLRAVHLRQRWFWFTAAVAALAVLHGLIGLSWLVSSAAAAAVASVGIGDIVVRTRRAGREEAPR